MRVPSPPAPDRLRSPPPRPGGDQPPEPLERVKEGAISAVDWVDERAMLIYLVTKLGISAPPWLKAEEDEELRSVDV